MPLKAYIRRHRAKRLVEYFAKFKELYENEQEKDEKVRETPKICIIYQISELFNTYNIGQ